MQLRLAGNTCRRNCAVLEPCIAATQSRLYIVPERDFRVDQRTGMMGGDRGGAGGVPDPIAATNLPEDWEGEEPAPSLRRDRLMAALVLIAGMGLVLALPFAL